MQAMKSTVPFPIYSKKDKRLLPASFPEIALVQNEALLASDNNCVCHTWQVGGLAQVGGCMARDPGNDGNKQDACNDGTLEVAGHEYGHDCQSCNAKPQGRVRHLHKRERSQDKHGIKSCAWQNRIVYLLLEPLVALLSQVECVVPCPPRIYVSLA